MNFDLEKAQKIREKFEAAKYSQSLSGLATVAFQFPAALDEIERLRSALICLKITTSEECDGKCIDTDCPCPDIDNFDECQGCSLEKEAREWLQKEGFL